jgi:hypothetical protein
VKALRALFLRLGNLFGTDRLDRELHTELSAHLQLHIDDNLRAGMTPVEARRQALLRLGGLEPTKERVRDQRSLPFLETLFHDLRYALRMLRHNPGFTAAAVIVLALGIGANTALFSVVNAVLLRPLPYPHPEQLVTLRESKPNFATGSISLPNFLDWQKDNRTFASMAALRGGRSLVLSGLGDAEQLNAVMLTCGFFEQLAVSPLIGRTFTQDEEKIGAAPTVLLAARLWPSLHCRRRHSCTVRPSRQFPQHGYLHSHRPVGQSCADVSVRRAGHQRHRAAPARRQHRSGPC